MLDTQRDGAETTTALGTDQQGREAGLNRRGPTMDEMASEVADATGVSVYALRGPRRVAEIVQPRHALMYRAHVAGRGIAQIGRWLKRDHTTVLHGIRAHQKRYAAGEVDHLGRPT